MTDALPQKFAYRSDIDGLRAIAVLAVVIFHLGFSSVEGGFLGVDVFFVISGFLITSIIAPQITHGTFSFGRFYLRRIRRLLPPAFATVAATFVVSAFILTPYDFIAFAKSAIASLFSVSNILFFTEAGYWDSASELKPLLHTWSLGVEEQFYLFWPALIFAICKLCRVARRGWVLGAVLVVITIAGVILSERLIRYNPFAAFYLLPARGFEFALGAVFASVVQSKVWSAWRNIVVENTLFLISLVILLATFFIYKGTTPFPGFNALLPCFATVGLLLSGQGVLGRYVFSNAVMVWLGRVSYSMYLVHWPIVALLRYNYGLELSVDLQVIAALATLGLTCVLHYGVERPLSARSGFKSETPTSRPPKSLGRFAVKMLATSVILSGICVHVIASDGWTFRFSDLQLSPAQIEEGKRRRFTHIVAACTMTNYDTASVCDAARPLQVMVIGNSHAPDGFNFLKAAYGGHKDVQLIYFGSTNRCKLRQDTVGDWESDAPKCQPRMTRLMSDTFLSNLDVVVYSANTPFRSDKAQFLELFKTLKSKSSDLKLMTMGGFTNTETDCARLINETGRASSCFDRENVKSHPGFRGSEALANEFLALTDHYVDRVSLLCQDETPESCRTDTLGTPAFYDHHHISLEYSEMSGKLYAEKFPHVFHDIVQK